MSVLLRRLINWSTNAALGATAMRLSWHIRLLALIM